MVVFAELLSAFHDAACKVVCVQHESQRNICLTNGAGACESSMIFVAWKSLGGSFQTASGECKPGVGLASYKWDNHRYITIYDHL